MYLDLSMYLFMFLCGLRYPIWTVPLVALQKTLSHNIKCVILKILPYQKNITEVEKEKNRATQLTQIEKKIHVKTTTVNNSSKKKREKRRKIK